ncbi:MAG: hypothetical protein HKN92_06030 [Chitinophagales bacterium]|nr:hypothetical protein [Chitinophagales bacterium]
MRKYITSLWEHSKIASILLGIFVVGQVFLSYKGIEITPWLHWGMYSKADTQKKAFTIYRIEADGERVLLSNFNDLQRECIYSPLEHYAYLIENNFKEPYEDYYISKIGTVTKSFTVEQAIEEQFQKWYKKRLSAYLNNEVKSIALYKVRYKYENGRAVEEKQKLIQTF